MKQPLPSVWAAIPSVDALLRAPAADALINQYGITAVTAASRDVLAEIRRSIREAKAVEISNEDCVDAVAKNLEARMAPGLLPVFNLTGTVLHTNLGRAPLPQGAIDAIALTARGASNLEFDLKTGRRGDRDAIVEERLCRLTGGEAATIVNNNAAAVMLVLNSLANRKEVPVSRGELVEIGGAFRIPDIMSRSGTKLIEVGTTNRTHLKDYAEAVGPRTALLMKVHTSNYEIQGFTAEVSEKALADLAHSHELPMAVDLGSGALTDMTAFGLPHERTPMETLADGADLVTFSGDKLLGGPQAGLIVGRADLIARLKNNPFKRAIRCDKMTLAALDTVLGFYENPERLAEEVPSIRLLSRKADDIRAQATRLAPAVAKAYAGHAMVEVVDCMSQIGSGALPVEALPSAALALSPDSPNKKGRGRVLKRLATELRNLSVPVIGRIEDDRLLLDVRCLEDEEGFVAQLSQLSNSAS
ncbi:MAG: L-seryl-tRNA(Sec) selenium transferase [Pseudomonadota bacterium]|nr:L-seryl-tRNA(Sec) selenium transferase [Pseudomonadota bacterium]